MRRLSVIETEANENLPKVEDIQLPTGKVSKKITIMFSKIDQKYSLNLKVEKRDGKKKKGTP